MKALIKYRIYFLLGMLGITVFLGWGISLIRAEFSFDGFRSDGEGEAKFYESYQDSFPHYDNVIQVALKSPGQDIWDSSFLAMVEEVFEGLKTIPNVDTVLSPLDLKHLRWTGIGVIRRPVIRFQSDRLLRHSRAQVAYDQEFYSNFFSADSQYIAGALLVNPEVLDTDGRDGVSRAIDEQLSRFDVESVVSGVPYIRTQYVSIIQGEVVSFVGLAVGLTLLVTFFLYRSLWGMALPILVVGISLVWTIGFMAITGKPLDMLTNLLPSIMFVVGVADTIHLITRYQQDLQSGLEPLPAMGATLKEIGMAILLTSVTTAIGFASLVVSPLPPIKGFGLYAAAGVLFAYLISMALVPVALLWIKPDKIRENKGFGSLKIWDHWLERFYDWVKIHPLKIVGGGLG